MLDEKVAAAQRDLIAATESRNSDTKSSAGDKHETGRAMMQREVDNAGLQFQKALHLKNDLEQIDFDTKHNEVQPGSLVITDRGNFIFSVALGKISFADTEFYAISSASPIGQALIGTERGGKSAFQGKEIQVLNIG